MSARLGPAAFLSEAEVETILRSFSRKAPTSVRNRALVTLFYRTGLRCSEALDLAPGDLRLDSERPTLLVRSGKGDVSRVVGIHANAVEALRRWLKVRPESGFVFCTLTGGRLDDGYVRTMLRRKARKTGVARVHPHAFRATLAVELVLEGVPLPAVRDVLGHASFHTTDCYVRRVFPELAISAVIDR